MYRGCTRLMKIEHLELSNEDFIRSHVFVKVSL